MCGGVKFKHDNKEQAVFFPNPKAVLPVCLKPKGHTLIKWGCREEEEGMLPTGGWARHDSVLKGVWDKLLPQKI